MKDTRIFSFDVLRVLAIIGVVAIHAVTPLIMAYGRVDMFSWMVANFLDSASRFSVPVFVMVSGALLLSKKESATELWQKRLKRIGYPVLFWTIIYAYYYHFFRSDPLSLEMTVKRIVFEQPYEHLYFLYILLLLSLITPFLRRLLVTTSYHLLILFVTLVSCVLIGERRFLLVFWIPYLAYYLGGFIVSQIKFSKAARFLWLYILSILFITTGTYLLYSQTIHNSQSLYLYEYTSPFVITASFALFLYITRAKLSFLEKKKADLDLLASYSFGVYLVHPLIQDVVERFFLANTSIITALLTFFLVFSLSVVVTFVFRQLPGFKSFV